jgi:hypothetical protein
MSSTILNFLFENPLLFSALILFIFTIIVYFLTERGGIKIGGLVLSVPAKKGRRKATGIPLYAMFLFISICFLMLHVFLGQYFKNGDYKKEDWVGIWKVEMEYNKKLRGPFDAKFELTSNDKIEVIITAYEPIVIPALASQNGYRCVKGRDAREKAHLYELTMTPDKDFL